MALADPSKFKVETGTEVEAPRVVSGDYNALYSTSDGLNKMTVSTTKSNSSRYRHLVRIDVEKLSTNIYEESKKQAVSMSVYLVVDRPQNGYTVADAKKLVEGLVGFLSATSYSAVTKVLGGES
jgi:hypothetical protein